MSKKETHNIIEVCEFCRENHLEADVVGRWVWVKFAEKPSSEIRTLLKEFGFRWSKRRGEWAHNCGHKTTRSRSGVHPRFKYGSRPLESEVA
jgi:hypothetical protein